MANLSIKGKILGLDKSARILRELPLSIENKVLQLAVMAATRHVAKQIRRAAPRSKKGKRSKSSLKYGQLYRNIKVERFKKVSRRKGIRGGTISTGNAFWGRFLENGTDRMDAKPWFKPAFDASTEEATLILRNKLGEGIEREANKIAAKYGIN